MTIEEDIKNIVNFLTQTGSNDPDQTINIYDEADPKKPPGAFCYKYAQSIWHMQKDKLLEIISEDTHRSATSEFGLLINEYPYFKIKYSPLQLARQSAPRVYVWEERTFRLFNKDNLSKSMTFELRRKEEPIKGKDLIELETFKVLLAHWESVKDKKVISMEAISSALRNKNFDPDRTEQEKIKNLVGGLKAKIRSSALDENIDIHFDRKLQGYFIRITP